MKTKSPSLTSTNQKQISVLHMRLTGHPPSSPPPSPPPPPKLAPSRPVEIRSVWAQNLETEFLTIRSLIDRFPLISMDTEFPGVVIRPPPGETQKCRHEPISHYHNLKSNVDLLNLIQVGITISDRNGNLPDLGTDQCYIWEFNFRDFDIMSDPHNSDSVDLLKRQGIDFEKNSKHGIDSERFAELMMSSGLVLNDSVGWVTFHSAYDFGYLIKCLTQRPLPEDLRVFIELVRMYFGPRMFDLKYLMRFSDTLHGGLDRVAHDLGVSRVAGKSHQAGSDSLLTLHVYLEIRKRYFKDKDDEELQQYVNVLHGLALRL